MKNDERDENSPVETIHEKLKMLHMNEIDGRKRFKLWENKGNLEGGTDEYLEEKTPVEIIEEIKQRLRMSRMDTRLRTSAPRRKEEGGWENKTTED